MGIHSVMPWRVSDARTINASLTQPERFAAIFDRHFDAIHAYLARRVDGPRAEDLASTTFVVAFERRRSFRSEATSARPWLYGIAANLLRELWRAEERGVRLRDELQNAAAVLGLAADEPAIGELDAALLSALATLDPEQREVLLLIAWDELSYTEVAEALQIPVGTVRSRLSRARVQLVAHLTPATRPQESTR